MNDIQTEIATVKADETKAAIWYRSHLFYSGMIAGVVTCLFLAWVLHKL